MKRDISLFVVLLHPPFPSPPLLELQDRGVLCQHTPPLLETQDGGGVSFVDTPHSPLPRSKHKTEGGVSFVDTPPTPLSLKLQDRGVLSVNTPLPCSKRETEWVFLLSTCHHQPLPRLKHETEGVFPLLTHHHQPLPCSNCKTEGFSISTPPPSLETWNGGGVFNVPF